MKRKIVAPSRTAPSLEQIKKLVVIAMFSDDTLMEHLVLKGGNALDLVHRISTRASIDIDLSMKQDFPGGPTALKERIERALNATFRDENIAVFDVKFAEKPEEITADLASFWGGYDVEFKLIEQHRYVELANDIEALRRAALRIGNAGKFLIDISRYEFTEGKQMLSFEGYRVFVYSLEMILCEKLRAICQQLPEYGPIIKRSRSGSPRARDFVDIWMLCQHGVDPLSEQNRELLEAIFAAKKVPLGFLRKIKDQRDFHQIGFKSVIDTVLPNVKLEDNFDIYFNFVLGLIERLEPLGDM